MTMDIDVEYVPGQLVWIQGSEPNPNGPTWRTRWKPAIVIDPPSHRYPDTMKVRMWPSVQAMQDGKRGRKVITYLRDCMPDPKEEEL